MADKPIEPQGAAEASDANDSVPRRHRRRQLSVDDSRSEPAVKPQRQLHTLPLEPDADKARSGAASVGEHVAEGGLPPMGRLQSDAPDAKSTARVPQANAGEHPKTRFRIRHVLLVLGALLLGVVLLVAGAVYFTIEHYAQGLPSVAKLKAGYDPPQITRILARDGTLLSSVFTERRTVVPFEQVPDAAKLAFLAAEDAGFYEHEGLNYVGMLRALYMNIRRGHSVQGGSSITQQVVKNILLDAERSYERKIKESILAFRLESSLTKDEILWLYMNHIYLGHGRYGIEEAARYYFGKHAKELSLDESAILAGLIASPERYSPRKDSEKSLVRRAYVLDQMLKKGFVTQQLFDEVSARPLRLAPTEESESRLAPEIVDEIKARFSTAGASSSVGRTVHTTLDPELQAAARKAVRDNLDAYMQRHKLVAPFIATQQPLWGAPFSGHPTANRIYVGVVVATDDHTGSIEVRVGDVVGKVTLANEPRYNPTHLLPSEFTKPGAVLRVSVADDISVMDAGSKPNLRLELGPQSALVALDVRTRAVLAMVGGYEAVTGGLNRAIAARRQPGSTFKPLVYSYALHAHKFAASSMFPIKKPVTGSIEVAGQHFLSLRNALAQSNNEVSIQVFARSGPQEVVKWAHALGVNSRLEPDMSLALGSYEVTPLEMANAFATFASGGSVTEPVMVTQVEQKGSAMPEPTAPTTQPMTPEEAYMTTSLLRGVIDYGTGAAARRLGRELAGKTGTTNESKDTWFIGYSTDIVTAVWVGYDDARPLGKQESGAKTALPAWIAFMEAAHRNRPKTAFARPSGTLVVNVDPTTGLLPRPGQAETRSEEFLPGTEPNVIAPEVPSTLPAPSDAPLDPSLPADSAFPVDSAGPPDLAAPSEPAVSGSGAQATGTPKDTVVVVPSSPLGVTKPAP